MEQSIIVATSLKIPEVESAVATLQTELQTQITIEAKQAAQRPTVITYTQFKVTVIDVIQVQCQKVIDYARSRGLLWASIQNVKDAEAASIQQGNQLQLAYQEKERDVLFLEKRRDTLHPNQQKHRQWKWFTRVALLFGFVDGILAFASFRVAFAIYLSVIISVAIAVAVGNSYRAYCGWIKKAVSGRERWIKIAVVLSIAAIFFCWLGSLRVAASAAAVNIDPAFYHSQVAAPISALTIAGISLVLFTIVFALSLVYWISPDEKKQLHDYEILCTEIEKIQSDAQQLKTQKDNLEQNIVKEKADVRLMVNYLHQTINTIKSIADVSFAQYKKIYGQYRHDMPEFFAEPVAFYFDDTLFVDLQKEQAV